MYYEKHDQALEKLMIFCSISRDELGWRNSLSSTHLNAQLIFNKGMVLIFK